MELIAGVDLSTQSTTVEIRDLASGRLIASGRGEHPVTTPPVSEQHPHAWWTAFESAWAAVGSPEVAAIAVAGQQHGAVVLDADGDVVRPALLWNDTRSAPDAERLRTALVGGAAAWAEAVGSVPVAAFTISKLAWLHRTEPESWARLDRVVLPHDWMTSRLCGRLDGSVRSGGVRSGGDDARLTTDRGDASGTGYWSAADHRYRHDLLELIDPGRDWADALPRVAAPDEVVGEWRGAAVATGTGDNMGAALGLGIAPGEAVLSIGTSGTVYGRSARPTHDATGAVAGFADATGGFLPLVCTLNGAKVLDAVRRLLGVDHDEFDRLAMAGPSDGVTLVPYFDGERVPDLPDATGRFVGLRSDVSREQIARATVEGVVCGLLDGLDALGQQMHVSSGLVLTGGAARSAAVRAVVAGLADLPVTIPVIDEAVAAGACVQAAAAITRTSTDEIALNWGFDGRHPVEPMSIDRSSVRARYREAVAELRS